MPEQSNPPSVLRLSPDEFKQAFASGRARLISSTRSLGETKVDQSDIQLAEHTAWKTFLGKDIEVPPAPQELFDVLNRAKEQGITTLEPHYLPRLSFFEKEEKPRLGKKKGGGGKFDFVDPASIAAWKNKPSQWFFDQIQEGRVHADAAQSFGYWVLIDGIQKPDYTDGRQQYESDPLVPLVVTNRFGFSWNKITSTVLSAIANVLGADQNSVRLPRAIEFNILGNMYHPEWGQTNTWEWFVDSYASDSRLIGGCSDAGGLGYVNDCPSDDADGDIGFRPLVVFPH